VRDDALQVLDHELRRERGLRAKARLRLAAEVPGQRAVAGGAQPRADVGVLPGAGVAGKRVDEDEGGAGAISARKIAGLMSAEYRCLPITPLA
jgi:hypothetical protein